MNEYQYFKQFRGYRSFTPSQVKELQKNVSADEVEEKIRLLEKTFVELGIHHCVIPCEDTQGASLCFEETIPYIRDLFDEYGFDGLREEV